MRTFHASVLAAVLSVALAAPAVQAEGVAKTVTVKFAKGKTESSYRGKISGYGYDVYRFSAKQGQRIKIDWGNTPDAIQGYLTAVGHDDNLPMEDAVLPYTGTYELRILQGRSGGREAKQTYPYRFVLGLSDTAEEKVLPVDNVAAKGRIPAKSGIAAASQKIQTATASKDEGRKKGKPLLPVESRAANKTGDNAPVKASVNSQEKQQEKIIPPLPAKSASAKNSSKPVKNPPAEVTVPLKPAKEAAAVPPESKPAPSRSTAWVNYRCEQGKVVRARYLPDGNVQVAIKNKVRTLNANGAQGDRNYRSGNAQWSVSGSDQGRLVVSSGGKQYTLRQGCSPN